MAKRSKQKKGLSGPKGGMGMMQQIQQLQEQVLAAQEELAETTVSASVGGGAVTVVITGDQRCQSVEIAPELLEEGDVEMLQDLLLTAFNSALDRSRELASDKLGPLASGLPL
ncbi:MAG: YbaB/EbfC family nucleoid-associated protein [Anaerolineales bacterium]|jgi:DNA-binding YbaB/EbfC family protein